MKKYNWLEKCELLNVLEQYDSFWRNLSSDAYPLTQGKFRIPISLEAFIINQIEYQDLERDLLNILSAAKKIANAYFFNADIRNIIVINEQEKALVEESAEQDFVGIIRPDLFWGKSPRLIEINADFPDGFFMHDITANHLKNFVKEGALVNVRHDILFSELLEDQSVAKSDHVFIAYNQERSFLDEFYLTKLQLAKLGWSNISVGTFEDLIYKNEQFYYDGKRVDVIRRGAEMSKLIKNPKLIKSLVQSQKVGAVKIINNFKNRLLGHKSLLIALSSALFNSYLNTEEIASIKKLLPKTLKLTANSLTLVENIKENWVLKPADLTEGEGIYIGKDTTRDKWISVLKTALDSGQQWILQEKIDIPEVEFNLINEDKRNIQSSFKKYDFDPHVVLFKNRQFFGHNLVRFSESSVLNIMQGGGLTYAFIKK